MPATPAWPPESKIRLFVDTMLALDGIVTAEGGQAHYLTSVMRVKADDLVLLFDDVSGEWLGRVLCVGRRNVRLSVDRHIRPREVVPDLWLGAAPIRRARFDWVAEKACELGVARFTPVLTRRSVVDKVNGERLRAHMVEAAEQCGRTSLPLLDAPAKLGAWLGQVAGRTLYFADEAGGSRLADAVLPGPAAMLVGPEGGFADDERELILSHPSVARISLGPRILRADTAAVASIANWMQLAGDW